MKKIKILDSCCGTGKTSWMIQKMRQEAKKKWIYICPYLKEVDRIIRDCPECKFKQPKVYQENNMKFKKSEHLYDLVQSGVNIASTHEMFRHLNSDTVALMHEKGYNLVLDEVIEIVEPLKFNTAQVQALFDTELLALAPIDKVKDSKKELVKKVIPGTEDRLDDFAIQFSKKERYTIETIREYANNDRLVWVNNSMLLWLFPSDTFKGFDSVYILTYLFEGSLQQEFYTLNDMDYDSCSVTGSYDKGFSLADFNPQHEIANRLNLKNQIKIYDGQDLNMIGNAYTSLSKNWWIDPKERVKREKNMGSNIRNYFRSRIKTAVNTTLWTCFDDNKGRIKPTSYIEGWISCNQKATNLYKDKRDLAFPLNRFLHPMVNNFFKAVGIELRENLFAISELIQWLFRSRLRMNQSINLYLPSRRMRDILNAWFIDGLEAKGSVIKL